MTLTALIFTIFGIGVGAYWHLHAHSEQAQNYRSHCDKALTEIISQVTQTLGRALEPVLLRLRGQPNELLMVTDDFQLLRNPTDILKMAGIQECLQDYANHYAELLGEYPQVRKMCDSLVSSLRRLRKCGLWGAGGSLVIGLAAFIAQLLCLRVPVWIQVTGVAMIAVMVMFMAILKARQDSLADRFTDKCSQLARHGARAA